MPTYEYQCDTCKTVHEVFQSITAKPIRKCPGEKCSGKVKRLLGSGSGFLFKGDGFYSTDYRSKSYTDGKKKDEGCAKQESGGKPCGSGECQASGA